MKCPNDATPLHITERQGIEVDYCPECRGVWLDRGELDKIIDRAASPEVRERETRWESRDRDHDRRPDRDDRRPDSRYDARYETRYRKRKSFLSEIFDFD